MNVLINGSTARIPLPSSPATHCLVTENRLHSSRPSSSTTSPHQRSTMPLRLSSNSNLKLRNIEWGQKAHFSIYGISTTCSVSAPFKGTRVWKVWHLFRLVAAFGLSHRSLAESQNVLRIMLKMTESLSTIQMIRFSGWRNRLCELISILRRSVLTCWKTMKVKMGFLKMIQTCVLG